MALITVCSAIFRGKNKDLITGQIYPFAMKESRKGEYMVAIIVGDQPAIYYLNMNQFFADWNHIDALAAVEEGEELRKLIAQINNSGREN